MQLIENTSLFLNKLTKQRLTDKQLKTACIYLRAKGVSFYDNWSKEHCLPVSTDPKIKSAVISAIEYSIVKSL